MYSVHWIDPDTLRVAAGPTGLVRFAGNRIEVNVEIYGEDVPDTIGPYIARTLELFERFPIITNSTEPEPEPDFLPDLQEPQGEEPIWGDFIEGPYLYYHPNEPLIYIEQN